MLKPFLVAAMLLTVLMGSAAAQGGDSPGRRRIPSDRNRIEIGPKLQPPNTIRVSVQYKKEYGYRSERGLFDSGPNSCGAFSVSARPDTNDRKQDLIRITTEPKMRDSAGFYVCDYLISELPLAVPIRVDVGMADSRTTPIEAWMGGTQSEPPRRYRRVILDGTRYVTLTERSSRASLVFEMIYDLPPLR